MSGGRSGSMLSVGANSEDPPAVQERDEAQMSDTGQGKSDHNTVPACQKEESNRTEKPKQAGKSTPVVGLTSVRNTVRYPKRECQICGRSVIDSQVCFLCVFH